MIWCRTALKLGCIIGALLRYGKSYLAFHVTGYKSSVIIKRAASALPLSSALLSLILVLSLYICIKLTFSSIDFSSIDIVESL